MIGDSKKRQKNNYKQKLKGKTINNDADLWNALTDKDYHQTLALYREYYKADYAGTWRKKQYIEAASLIGLFRKYRRKLGLTPTLKGFAFRFNKPNPNAKTWQDVWENLTDKPYDDVYPLFADYRNHYHKRNKTTSRAYSTIRTFRRHCKLANISYPIGKNKKPSDEHPWKQPYVIKKRQ